jgi:hypothetical protein
MQGLFGRGSFFLHLLIILSSASASGGIIGNIDAVRSRSDGTVLVQGWACDSGISTSINVHVYVGNQAGFPGAHMIGSFKADFGNESAVNGACGTSGSRHRFEARIAGEKLKAHAGKPVFVHGISLSNGPNWSISGGGRYRLPSAGIDGYLDGVREQPDGSILIQGWACDRFISQPVSVHIYGGVNGATRMFASGTANVASEPGVSERCLTAQTGHRFRVLVRRSVALAFSGKSIFVYGISRTGGHNLAIGNSGNVRMPVFSSQQALSRLAVPGQDLTIPSGFRVIVDTNVDVRNLKVSGQLVCPASGNYMLRLAGLNVEGDGALFECGTPSAPFAGKLKISVKPGVDMTAFHPCRSPGNPCSDRNLMAMHGGVIRLTGQNKNAGWAKLRVTAEAGAREIFLTRAMNWSPGDRIALSPTGLEYLEAEDVEIESVSGDRIRLKTPLRFHHHGEIETMSTGRRNWTVDQRAEVANLTRNIQIVTDGNPSTFGEKGAHMMVMMGGAAYIDSVEFAYMGRMGEMARYPFHWHRSGDVQGQYIRNSSVHHSYQRCITVHGTLNSVVHNNVCYDHYGHGFFLENGDEMGNHITNNLGILSRRPLPNRHILQSDVDESNPERFPGPATFWISNPANVVRGNVAAGSRGTGFWMSFNQSLSCDDAHFCQLPDSQHPVTIRPAELRTTSFGDNVAKAAMVGFTWDGTGDGGNAGNPRNPDDRLLIAVFYRPPSAPVFNNLVMYKNRMSAIYLRAYSTELRDVIMVDNRVGHFSAFNNRVRGGLIAAHSRSYTAADEDRNRIFHGVRIYDGPFDLSDVDFVNFQGFTDHAGRAVQPLPIVNVGGAERFFDVTRSLRFSPEPQVRVHLNGIVAANLDTIPHLSVRDLDGTLTGSAGAVLVPNHPFRWDASCVQSSFLSNALRCYYQTAQVYLYNGNVNPFAFNVTRVDRVTGATVSAVTTHYHHAIGAILGGRYEYIYDAPPGISLQNMYPMIKAPWAGMLSPVVTMRNLPRQNCTVPNVVRVNSMGELRAATDDAFYSNGNQFSFRLKARNPSGLLDGASTTPMAEGRIGPLNCM